MKTSKILNNQWWESTHLLYLSKSKDILIENNSSKSESYPVKSYLRIFFKVFAKIYLSIKSKNHFKFLILSRPDSTNVLFFKCIDRQGHTPTLIYKQRHHLQTKHLCLVSLSDQN